MTRVFDRDSERPGTTFGVGDDNFDLKRVAFNLERATPFPDQPEKLGDVHG